MCGDAPTPPPGPLPANPPGGSAGGTGLCCACPASGDVATNGVGTYVTAAYSTTTTRTNKCRLAIQRTQTGGSVTITKSFGLSYTNGATEAADKGRVTAAITSAFSAWQSAAGSYRIQVEQPGCSSQKLTILFSAIFPASGADVAVTVNGQPAPPAPAPDLRMSVAGGTAFTFFVNKRGDIAWSSTHELGHTFGLADEYTYNRPAAAPAPTVLYKGASDPDRTVTLVHKPAKSSPGNEAFENDTVMGVSGNTTFPDYLYYWVAIEVKAILQAAGVTAVVKVVAP